jgi:hypothetical protein
MSKVLLYCNPWILHCGGGLQLDLLYDVWVDSLGYGAQFDCNSISMTLADSSGASTFSFTIQPTDLANAPPRPTGPEEECQHKRVFGS